MSLTLSSPLPRLLVLAGSAVALSACGMFEIGRASCRERV